MRLTVVGMSGSYAGPDSPASCYLVEEEQAGRCHRILLDLGSGALGPLQRFTDLRDIDAVLFSHLHADHCLDLCGYYVVRKYHPAGPLPPIPVWGPPGTARRMARAYDLPDVPGMSRQFDFRTFPADPFRIGPFTITTTRVAHPVPTYALRVEAGGRSLVYSGDTGECRRLVELARGCDLFLCEASFLERNDNPSGLHLTGRQAGEHATAAGVGRLLLTHVPPLLDSAEVLADAKPAFAGPLELARPEASYDV